MLATMRVGEGPHPVLLVHGFLGSGRNLGALARRWVQADPDLSLVLPDLTGHGTSPALPPGAGIQTVARDLLDTARAEGLSGPLSIVGHSQGGRVALAASLLEPGAVRDITLLDIGPGPIDTSTSESAQVLEVLLAVPDQAPDRGTMREALLGAGLSRSLADWLLMNLVHTEDGYRWRIDRAALSTFHRRANAEDLWPAIEGGSASVRCVRGGRSAYVSDADARRMEAAGCPVATIGGAGHYVHVDGLEELVELLTGRRPWR